MADALEYAHRRGVLHRDIKPSNLLLDALGNVWVTDFGLAKLEEGDDLSQSRELVGTLRYMAPERFQGTSDRRGDIYSLGATLYELLALRPLFEESDPIRLIERIRNDAPTRAAAARPAHPARPGDDRPEGAGQGAEGPVRLGGRAGRRAAAVRRGAADPVAAGVGRRAVLALVQARPVAGRGEHRRGGLDDGAGTGRRPGPRWFTAASATRSAEITLLIQQAEAETRKNLFDALLARARATRYSRQVGQRFDALAALDRAQQIARELRLPPDRLEPLRDEAIACLALPDLKPTEWAITRPTGMDGITFDPTMTRYALRFRDGTISVRRVADDQEVASLPGRRSIATSGSSASAPTAATWRPRILPALP